jgi:predicted RNA-binding Zn ribbon-like protein
MSADEAPGELEVVRSFLNTWSVPNDGRREPLDELGQLRADPAAWERALPGLRRPGLAALPQLRHMRTVLREALGRSHPTGLAPWLSALPLRPHLHPDESGRPVSLVPQRVSAAGQLLAIAVDAVSDGDWPRLRACPDCRYVFYDSSRNGSRTWCRMTREDEHGRSCGSLAKARAKRARDRMDRSAPTVRA